MSILDDDLAGLVADGLEAADLAYDAMLIVTAPGEVDPGDELTIPAPMVTEYPCRGFVDNYTDYQVASGLVLAGDRKIAIIRPSLAVEPAPGMSVKIRGRVWSVIDVKTDPATALWELQCRVD